MIEILTNPNKFFEAKMGEEVSLKLPSLIVLIVGIISGISSFLQNSITVKMMSEVPPEAQSIVAIMSTVSVIGLVILYLIFWVFIAGIFHLISCIFKGEGDFNRTLEFVGYGYIPMIFGGIISAILMYIIVSTAQIPVVTDPAKIAETLGPLLKSPMMLISYAISFLFMLWSANIWIFGLKHARNLTTKNAVITIAIPVASYYVIMTYILYLISQMGVV